MAWHTFTLGGVFLFSLLSLPFLEACVTLDKEVWFWVGEGIISMKVHSLIEWT